MTRDEMLASINAMSDEELTRRLDIMKRSNFMSEYLRQPTEQSFCKVCNSPVTLLCRKDGEGAMFYICFVCTGGRIFQVGVGEVLEEKS